MEMFSGSVTLRLKKMCKYPGLNGNQNKPLYEKFPGLPECII
jgi:hypothetical protein